MHLLNIDAYFHLASKGNKEAYNTLYQIFTKRAKLIINSKIHSSPNYTGIPEDFTDLIDKYFFQTINEYDVDRGSFSNYVDFVLATRLAPKVESLLIANVNTYASLDDEFGDSNAIECIEDPNELPMSTTIALNSFKQIVASPNFHLSNEERLHQKIMMLQYAGYKDTEIQKYLKLTPGELRGHIKRIQNKGEMLNLKLELK